jgi:hypothetical protein
MKSWKMTRRPANSNKGVSALTTARLLSWASSAFRDANARISRANGKRTECWVKSGVVLIAMFFCADIAPCDLRRLPIFASAQNELLFSTLGSQE